MKKILGVEFGSTRIKSVLINEKGEVLSPNELLPFYLRLPQAERELKMKKENEKL